MVSVSVGFLPLEDPEPVPDGVIGDGLDLSRLSQSWLVSNWQLLGLKLDVFNLISLVLFVVL